MYSKGDTVPQKRHTAPFLLKIVPSCGTPTPVRILKCTVRAVGLTTGSIHTLLPAVVESQKDRTSGMEAVQAGFTQRTVLAQSQAMTVSLRPTSGFRSG